MRTLFLSVMMLVVSGCASLRGTVATVPTEPEIQSVRVAAVRAADTMTTALAITGELATALQTLPVSVAVKDRVDCGILKVVGATAPSTTVTRVCGAVPDRASAPLTKALTGIRSAGTCPSLRSSIIAAVDLFGPLMSDLVTSQNPALLMAAASLRVTLNLLASGGVVCA